MFNTDQLSDRSMESCNGMPIKITSKVSRLLNHNHLNSSSRAFPADLLPILEQLTFSGIHSRPLNSSC